LQQAFAFQHPHDAVSGWLRKPQQGAELRNSERPTSIRHHLENGYRLDGRERFAGSFRNRRGGTIVGAPLEASFEHLVGIERMFHEVY